MTRDWGLGNGEWGAVRRNARRARISFGPVHISNSLSDPQPPAPSPQPLREGVTLVELLVTMAIMAIISAAIMGTARAALESARKTRTQALVLKIGELVKERLASYETRRVDLNQGGVKRRRYGGRISSRRSGEPRQGDE